MFPCSVDLFRFEGGFHRRVFTSSFRKKEFPVEALGYAVEFNHPHIADAVAPLTVNVPLSEMRHRLEGSAGALLAWVRIP